MLDLKHDGLAKPAFGMEFTVQRDPESLPPDFQINAPIPHNDVSEIEGGQSEGERIDDHVEFFGTDSTNIFDYQIDDP